MIESEFSYIEYLIQNNFTTLINILFIIFSSLLIRFILSITGQTWVRTQHQTLTYIILPFISFIIASVIMNNIALSLGMIGALSIIRFRNPVKSSFELVMFFALLTLGISVSVDIKWGIILMFFIIIIISSTYIYEVFLSNIGKKPFSISFEEGWALHFLEVSSSQPLDVLKNNNSLIHFNFSKEDSIYNYKLAFKNKLILEQTYNMISSTDNIKDIDIRYSNQ
ncbi:MAG: hypothetical protein CMG64_07155 [Candidatus Marinimicrobia bacterium]|nr:hypothetical protein [Candidatus Neomarinimicrobiota bacterium]|tara:strand:- start:9449 stop:10120 length:672 start_codon:yes stop_codon:yes gene_type:complete